jgi:ribose/xylose/arabinose/galactoside ABC-type transport system permease subunit
MRGITREGLLALALLGACAGFVLASPYFATAGNLLAVAQRRVDFAVVALGETLVLAAGGIDVPAGVAMGVAAVVVGSAVQRGGPAALAPLAGPAVGLLPGSVAAGAVVLGQMPPIVATLALWGVWRAVLYLLLGGRWLSDLPPVFALLLNAGMLGIPPVLPGIVMLYGAAWLALRHPPAGPRLFAVGGREDAARMAGINVARAKALVYVIAGALSGVAATIYVAQYRNVEMTTGGTVPPDAFVAAILGGCSVGDGQAGLLGTALGVVLLRVVQNAMVLLGLASLGSSVVEGTLLIAVLPLAGAGRMLPRARRLA